MEEKRKRLDEFFKASKKGKDTTKAPVKASKNARKSPVKSARMTSTTSSKKSPKDWLSKYYELLRYKNEHGDCIIPRTTDLGKWVTLQRHRYEGIKGQKSNPLSPNEIKKLNAIDFEWDRNKAIVMLSRKNWNTMYEELKEYKEEHGTADVVYGVNKPLYDWISSQRKRFVGNGRPLDKDEMEKLRGIGVELER